MLRKIVLKEVCYGASGRVVIIKSAINAKRSASERLYDLMRAMLFKRTRNSVYIMRVSSSVIPNSPLIQ